MDLYSGEQFPTFPVEAAPAAAENIILRDNRSYEDPVLLSDSRILPNLLNRCRNNVEQQPQQPSYFDTVQTEIKPHMRKIVSDWMLEVCEEQQCQAEVFSLAVNYMDRFLARVNLKKNQFQLLACVCMFLASKFKETAPLPAENLVIYADNSVSTYEITQWEMVVLDVLQWDLSAVTPYSILDQLLRTLSLNPASDLKIDTVRKHAETFVALTATEHAFCMRSPAVVAVSCLGEALRGLGYSNLDSLLFKLEAGTGVSENDIKSCMQQIELSISLSMSGMSFQPNSGSGSVNAKSSSASTTSSAVVAVPPPTQSAPKIIPQQPNAYYPAQSTTPTDIMEVSSNCVY